jgi:DNA primase
LTFTLKLDPSHPYLVERGLSAELVAQFGLGYCSLGSMAGRICIPIHNAASDLVAYAGRWPGDELPEDVEKYRLPAKFEKSRVLYNLHRVADATHVVAVEGYWSAIRLHALGLPLVGLMGWSVSEEQIAALARVRHAVPHRALGRRRSRRPCAIAWLSTKMITLIGQVELAQKAWLDGLTITVRCAPGTPRRQP